MTPTTGSTASRFEHPVLDARWQAAEAVVERAQGGLLDGDGAYARIVASPLAAPDGTQLDFLFALTGYTGTEVAYRDAVLVAGDRVVTAGKATLDELAAFLHAQGFPAKHLHPGLVLEAVAQFGAVAPSFRAAMPRSPDDFAALAKPITSKHAALDLAYDAGGGATLAIYTRSGANVPYGADEADRATVKFDAAAKPTVTYDREQRDGTWVPLPKAP